MCAEVHLLDWRIVAFEENSDKINSQVYFLLCFLRYRNRLDMGLIIIHYDEI